MPFMVHYVELHLWYVLDFDFFYDFTLFGGFIGTVVLKIITKTIQE